MCELAVCDSFPRVLFSDHVVSPFYGAGACINDFFCPGVFCQNLSWERKHTHTTPMISWLKGTDCFSCWAERNDGRPVSSSFFFVLPQRMEE